MQRLRILLATGFGSGYAPVASGTFGSMVGIALFWPISSLGGPVAGLVALLIVTPLGFWAAEGGAQHFAKGDPGQVVIDEIAGQFLTLLWLPVSIPMYVAGFLLFRVLDILKPFPARRLEVLHGGSGIMADDLMVAIYANLVLRAVHWYAPAFLGGS